MLRMISGKETQINIHQNKGVCIMFKPLLYPILIVFLIFAIMGCSQDEPVAPEGNLDTGPTFLLVSDDDPLQLESDHAFMMDGTGPIFLGVLDLSEEQKEQIREIVSSYRAQFRALRSQWQSGASWEEIHNQRKALREQIHNEIMQVLTPEQQVIIQEIQDQLASGVYPDILVNKRLEELTALLTLTQEQQNQIRPLLAQAGADMLAAREAAGNIRELREALRTIFENLDQQISALLTPEQLEIYNDWKTQHRHRGRHSPGH
jgi:Spy/CpxP family protein refolding chaperone